MNDEKLTKTSADFKALFQDFVESLPSAEIDTLPINHIANVSFIDNFLTSKNLPCDYLITQCEVHEKHVLYFFYGKPAFRLDDKNAYPLCLIFKNFPHQPYKAYPFDSGAFFHGRMAKYFDSLEVKLEQYEISPNYEVIKKIIRYFFGSNERYYEGNPIIDLTKSTNPLVDSYISMITEPETVDLDQRRSSIEVIFEKDFMLNDNNLEMIVLPETDFILSGTTIEFNDVVKTISELFNCKIKSYPQKTGDPYLTTYPQINKIVKSFIDKYL